MKTIIIIEDDQKPTDFIREAILELFIPEEVNIIDSIEKIEGLNEAINDGSGKEWISKNLSKTFDLIIIDVALTGGYDEKGLELFQQLDLNDNFIVLSKYDPNNFRIKVEIGRNFINKQKNRDWRLIRPIKRLIKEKIM
jgi:DNA-binding NarL/FixJ family response regulator